MRKRLNESFHLIAHVFGGETNHLLSVQRMLINCILFISLFSIDTHSPDDRNGWRKLRTKTRIAGCDVKTFALHYRTITA